MAPEAPDHGLGFGLLRYLNSETAEEAVRDLATGWFQALDALAAHATTPCAGGHTPSDMALVSVSQEDIDELETEWVM